MEKQIKYKGYIIKASTSKYEVLCDGIPVLLNGSYEEAEGNEYEPGEPFGKCKTVIDGILYGKLVVDTIQGNIPKKYPIRKIIIELHKLKRKINRKSHLADEARYNYKLRRLKELYQDCNRYFCKDFFKSSYPEAFS